jgi:hypothetical protein
MLQDTCATNCGAQTKFAIAFQYSLHESVNSLLVCSESWALIFSETYHVFAGWEVLGCTCFAHSPGHHRLQYYISPVF